MKLGMILVAVLLSSGVGHSETPSNAFTGSLLDTVDSPDGNRFFSPFSIRTALAMTSLGADGDTLKQMDHVLSFKNPRDAAVFGRAGNRLAGELATSDVVLSLANRLWVESGFPVLKSFQNSCRNAFDADAAAADFSNSSDQERVAINAWVENQTHEKIPELFPPGVINSRTRIVLVNAIYFKAAWERPFPLDATDDAVFTNADGSESKVRMMRQKALFKYADDGDFQVLELPYQGGRLAMVVLLPKNPNVMPGLTEWLTDSSKIESLQQREVIVKLPKFSLRDRIELVSPLQSLGMRDAFDPVTANFSRMSATSELYISDVVHEAFIEVNETGTEAAAATGVVMDLLMAPADPPVEFIADRPFWFFIRDQQSQEVLFVGRLSNQ